MKGKWISVLIWIVLVMLAIVASPMIPTLDAAGLDCVSNASDNWNTAGTWTSCGGGTPGSGDNVFIQSGHIVTLTQNESVNDLNVSMGTSGSGGSCTGTTGVLAVGANTLQVNGRLRGYAATVGTTPGNDCQARSTPITMTASSSGKVSFVGNSRNITNSNQWSAGNIGTTTTFAIEINMDAGQTATMGTSIKASKWDVVAGTLDTGVFRIAIDNGTTGQGNMTIASGATVTSAATGTGTSAVVGRTGSAAAGTLTVDGTLVLTGASPKIAMAVVSLNGTVQYGYAGVQTIAEAINSGAAPSVYTNLIVNSGTTLNETVDATVSGALTNGGTIRNSNSVSSTGAQSFSLTGVTMNVTSGTGTITVDRVDANHPNATGSASGIATGKYWQITGTGFTADLTLPHSALASPKVCKYPGGLGGAGWDCQVSSSTSNTVTRNGVTSFSDWAVGNNVGATAVTLRALAAHTPARPWAAALPLLALAAAGGVAFRRRRA